MADSRIDLHGALRPLADACRLAKADISLADTLLNAPRGGGPLVRKAVVFFQHLRFVLRVWSLRRGQHLLVREFSNVPLALLFPLIYPWKKRLLFVVNHNLQWAENRQMERAAFLLLGRMRCRFVFFERIPEARLHELGISPQFSTALLHPVPESMAHEAPENHSPTVGITGEYRPEKNTDELLKVLVSQLPEIDLVAGVPNPERFRACSPFAGSNRIRIVDTSSTESYRRTIAGCDAIVLSHPAAAYRFRASGLIADAAACGTAVVVPNLPILGKQAAGIGEAFQGLDQMPDAVRRAIENQRAGRYNFKAYCAARSAERMALMLDEFCNG